MSKRSVDHEGEEDMTPMKKSYTLVTGSGGNVRVCLCRNLRTVVVSIYICVCVCVCDPWWAVNISGRRADYRLILVHGPDQMSASPKVAKVTHHFLNDTCL